MILRTIHALAQLINIRQHVALLLLQAFQFAAKLLPLFLGARLLERGLEFLESLIHRLLASREFLKPVDCLDLLAPLRILHRSGLALRLVTIVRLGQIELIHLLLVATPTLPASPASASRNTGLVLLKPEQVLIGILL